MLPSDFHRLPTSPCVFPFVISFIYHKLLGRFFVDVFSQRNIPLLQGKAGLSRPLAPTSLSCCFTCVSLYYTITGLFPLLTSQWSKYNILQHILTLVGMYFTMYWSQHIHTQVYTRCVYNIQYDVTLSAHTPCVLTSVLPTNIVMNLVHVFHHVLTSVRAVLHFINRMQMVIIVWRDIY